MEQEYNSSTTVDRRALRDKALKLTESRVVLTGTPTQVIGAVKLRRNSVPAHAFSTMTMDPTETYVGHLQELQRGEMLKTSIDQRFCENAALGLGMLPREGEEGSVPMSLCLHPQTPPGQYNATLRIAGDDVEAEIDVLPERRFRILTSQIVATGSAGETVYARMLIQNEGNLAEDFSGLGRLVLQEDQQICLSLQEAISAVKSEKEEGHGFVRFADQFVTSLANRQTNSARVSVAGGKRRLEGGETAELALAIKLPGDLKAGHTYVTVLNVVNASVGILIVATAPSTDKTGSSKKTKDVPSKT